MCIYIYILSLIAFPKEKSKRIFYLLTTVVLICGIISAAAAGVVLNFKEATAAGDLNEWSLGSSPNISESLVLRHPCFFGEDGFLYPVESGGFPGPRQNNCDKIKLNIGLR